MKINNSPQTPPSLLSRPASGKPSAPAPERTADGYPELDDVFDGYKPRFSDPDFNLYMGTTQLPQAPEESKSYYDESAQNKIQEQYYKDVDLSASGLDLVKDLSKRLKSGHKNEAPYQYTIAKHLYTEVDRHPDGVVRSIYDKEPVQSIREPVVLSPKEIDEGKLDQMIAAGAAIAPEALATFLAFKNKRDGAFNCEHVVPQSWFGKKDPMRSDLHHLFTSNRRDNSVRGNQKYGENGSGYTPRGGKGEVARATLYFMTRYHGEVKTPYNSKDVEMFKRWSKEDPPSLAEKHRNAEIHKIQGNRNPFIDRPDLVDRLAF